MVNTYFSITQILSAPCIHVYSYNTNSCMLLVQSIKVNLSGILITFEYQSRVCLSRIPSHEFECVHS